MKFLRLLTLSLAIAVPLMVQSCAEKLQSYMGDTRPANSLGSIRDLLEEKGGYTQFLKGVELTGFDRLVSGGGLITVLAPDDEAFGKFLQDRYGVSDVADAPLEDMKVIIPYHIIQFAYKPIDFLAFTMKDAQSEKELGDGSCYKYKTYSKAAPYDHFDPVRKRHVNVYNREKFLPVFSTRLFKSRGVADPEAEYRRFFPNVGWQGADDKLYAGDAAVLETGIPSDNGYLYTVDRVLEPLPSVYEALADMPGCSIFKKMLDIVSCYTYDATVTRNFSASGDSLYYFYHWKSPARASELPELASEWTYHDEAGVVFDRALRYCNTCFVPSDAVLEPYLKEYFKAWGTFDADDFLSVIPKNGIYHFLVSHLYGGADIILPSDLDKETVNGTNGERYSISSSEVGVKFCSNGVIYTMDRIFEPAVYVNITAPLFKNPDYTFYARAYNVKNIYQQTVDGNNKFTIFIQSDRNLQTNGGFSSSETVSENGTYTFRKNSGTVMGESEVSNNVMGQFVYGEIPNLSNISSKRYFVAKNGSTYLYVKDHRFYDSRDEELIMVKRDSALNGAIYELDRMIPGRDGAYAVTGKKADYSEWRALLISANIGNANGQLINYMASQKDMIVFLPTNEAVREAKSAGLIPPTSDQATLAKYLEYYFVPLKKNQLDHFLLPGLGPDGMTDEPFEGDYITMSEFKVQSDAKTIHIAWDPENSSYLSITDMAGGQTIRTRRDSLELRTNAACFTIDHCFDYSQMLGDKQW